MHHVTLDRWSRGASALHRRDPRVKIAAVLVFLVVLATAHRDLAWLGTAMFFILCIVARQARIPLAGALARAGVVLPFTAVFAGASWLAGDPARGAALVMKSYLSALAVLLLSCAGLLIASWRRLDATDVGFDRTHMLTFLIRPSEVIYPVA